MPKVSKAGYYAVRIGRVPGIYRSWADCEAQVKGFIGATYKKLNTEAEAIDFMAARGAAQTSASRESAPVASSSQATVVPDPTRLPWATRSTPEDEKGFDVVYCDGACKGNGQVGSIAGIGVWWGHGDPRNISERCPGDQTNNRAELIAIVRILETTSRLKRPLLIKTDSNYSIQCVTSWISKWMKNGFLAADGKPVKNRTLIKYLAALLHVRRKTSQTVEFRHVRGHVGIDGNEAADQLANFGTTKPVVPERDWDRLEKQALQTLKPVAPLQAVDDELKAYADGLLSDDELAELADTSFNAAILSVRQHSESAVRDSVTSTSPVPLEDSPPRIDATGFAAARAGDGTTTVRSKLPRWDTFRPTAAATPPPQLAPSKKPIPTVSEAELEAFSSCLLDDDELSALGRHGMFDSDF